jgi:hypothetical protein
MSSGESPEHSKAVVSVTEVEPTVQSKPEKSANVVVDRDGKVSVALNSLKLTTT